MNTELPDEMKRAVVKVSLEEVQAHLDQALRSLRTASWYCDPAVEDRITLTKSHIEAAMKALLPPIAWQARTWLDPRTGWELAKTIRRLHEKRAAKLLGQPVDEE